MKIVASAVVSVAAALALSACGSSASPGVARTSRPAPLAKRLATEARRMARSLGDPSVETAQVYGPNSHYRLVKESSGDLVEKNTGSGFYLIVIHGHFTCSACSTPGGTAAQIPRGTIATDVWSPKAGNTDGSVGNRLGAMSHLRGPTVIKLTG